MLATNDGAYGPIFVSLGMNVPYLTGFTELKRLAIYTSLIVEAQEPLESILPPQLEELQLLTRVRNIALPNLHAFLLFNVELLGARATQSRLRTGSQTRGLVAAIVRFANS